MSEEHLKQIMSMDSKDLENYILGLYLKEQDLKQQLEEEKNSKNKAIEYCQIINDSDYVYSQDEVTNKVLQILQNKE